MPVPVLDLGFRGPPGVPGGVPGAKAEAEAGLERDEGVIGELIVAVAAVREFSRIGEGSWSCARRGRLAAVVPNNADDDDDDDDDDEMVGVGTGTAGLSP